MNEPAADPLTRRPPPPFPVSVLTGFLGAGKTSLLNTLLRDPALSDALVLINEFGEIGLDHLLVEGLDGDMMLMASGCLCCTIRGELVDRLEDLTRRRDNGRIKPFTRLLIETTGLADPAPVLHTFLAHPYLSRRYTLDSVITAVDAVNGLATLDAHDEAVKQVAMADRLVLTKSDLLDDDTKRRALIGRLEALNPGAPILDGARGDATAARLLDAGPFDASGKIPDVTGWLNAEAYRDPHPHHHDVNRHSDRIRAFAFESDRAIAPQAFGLFLDLLQEALGENLLRLKGLIRLSDDPDRPVVIHGVQTVCHPPVRLPAWPDATRTTRLVFIGRDLDPAVPEKLWAAFTNVPAVDTPDAVALTANPLAPTSAGGLFG